MVREHQAWLARAIQAERGAIGMPISQLADQSGMVYRVLHRALKCERDLSVEQLARIAQALGVSVSYLVLEAERRRNSATAAERAAVIIESDRTLTAGQKATLKRESETLVADVQSSGRRGQSGEMPA